MFWRRFHLTDSHPLSYTCIYVSDHRALKRSSSVYRFTLQPSLYSSLLSLTLSST